MFHVAVRALRVKGVRTFGLRTILRTHLCFVSLVCTVASANDKSKIGFCLVLPHSDKVLIDFARHFGHFRRGVAGNRFAESPFWRGGSGSAMYGAAGKSDVNDF